MLPEIALAPRNLRARALGFDDAEALQALLGRCAAYFRLADGRAPPTHAGLERIAEALGDERLRLWGLWAPGARAPSGILELRLEEPAPGEATIVLLLLEPVQRGKGLGRDVVEALVEALRDAGVASLHLGVQDHEERAHAFWEALGFSAVSREPGVTNYVRELA